MSSYADTRAMLEALAESTGNPYARDEYRRNMAVLANAQRAKGSPGEDLGNWAVDTATELVQHLPRGPEWDVEMTPGEGGGAGRGVAELLSAAGLAYGSTPGRTHDGLPGITATDRQWTTTSKGRMGKGPGRGPNPESLPESVNNLYGVGFDKQVSDAEANWFRMSRGDFSQVKGAEMSQLQFERAMGPPAEAKNLRDLMGEGQIDPRGPISELFYRNPDVEREFLSMSKGVHPSLFGSGVIEFGSQSHKDLEGAFQQGGWKAVLPHARNLLKEAEELFGNSEPTDIMQRLVDEVELRIKYDQRLGGAIPKGGRIPIKDLNKVHEIPIEQGHDIPVSPYDKQNKPPLSQEDSWNLLYKQFSAEDQKVFDDLKKDKSPKLTGDQAQDLEIKLGRMPTAQEWNDYAAKMQNIDPSDHDAANKRLDKIDSDLRDSLNRLGGKQDKPPSQPPSDEAKNLRDLVEGKWYKSEVERLNPDKIAILRRYAEFKLPPEMTDEITRLMESHKDNASRDHIMRKYLLDHGYPEDRLPDWLK